MATGSPNGMGVVERVPECSSVEVKDSAYRLREGVWLEPAALWSDGNRVDTTQVGTKWLQSCSIQFLTPQGPSVAMVAAFKRDILTLVATQCIGKDENSRD
ncbi:hypothetical protein SUGI_1085290 [Cryptomeria japonica]|nr:hypothetical protein SUGI_1085290 [Cryptomeria japonica]